MKDTNINISDYDLVVIEDSVNEYISFLDSQNYDKEDDTYKAFSSLKSKISNNNFDFWDIEVTALVKALQHYRDYLQKCMSFTKKGSSNRSKLEKFQRSCKKLLSHFSF